MRRMGVGGRRGGGRSNVGVVAQSSVDPRRTEPSDQFGRLLTTLFNIIGSVTSL